MTSPGHFRIPSLRILAIAAVAVCLGVGLGPWRVPLRADPPASNEPKEPDGGQIDPLGPNSACYVCHMTFVREEISKTHLAEKVGCVKCHGPSVKHANDENIGATPPDVTYPRAKIDAACGECHKSHKAPARQVIGRLLDRKLPTAPAPVCTDCHGRHRIDRAAPVREPAA